ncbi:multiprotein-bridging factor 1 family protein [Sphingomonas sp. ac-8]|uniref:helix-turn-helix domain-containing protein n=1 Tax=Sphingomonas sp. ac-8 TaxID=3242977 RepID=UPI003A7F9C5B
MKVQRAFYGWKRDTLAAMAGVSISTVERVERGEHVRTSSLEKLALALNQPPEAFTAKRVPLSEAEALAAFVQSFSWILDTVPVNVSPLRHEAQLRAMADTEVAVVTSDLQGNEADCAVEDLREYLDLTSFVRAENGVVFPKRERSFSLRRLYKDVIEAAREVERAHKAVCLIGTYEAKSSMCSNDIVRVGVVAVRSREKNPAAGAIKQMMALATIDMQAAYEAFSKRGD